MHQFNDEQISEVNKEAGPSVSTTQIGLEQLNVAKETKLGDEQEKGVSVSFVERSGVDNIVIIEYVEQVNAEVLCDQEEINDETKTKKRVDMEV